MTPTPPRAAPKPDVVQKLSFALVYIYVFLLFSRLPEYLTAQAGQNLYLAVIVASAAMIFTLFTGNFLKCFNSFQAICLLGFTGWLMVCILSSFWKTASFQVVTQVWLKSVIAFVLVVGAIRTLNQVKLALSAMALGLILVEVLTLFLGIQSGGRVGIAEYGSLANANALAFHIVVTVPCLFLMWMQGSWRWKIIAIPVMAYGMIIVILTGSRSGLIELGLLTLLIFVRVSPVNKVVLAIGAVIVVVVGSAKLSDDALERYKTMVQTDGESESYRSAVISQEVRAYNLKHSILITLEHPIFGIGPGAFAAYMAGESERDGMEKNWKNTHNAYTQVSSESGFPGFFLFFATIAASWHATASIYLANRKRPENRLLADVSYCLLMSLVMFTLNGAFDSNGYLYYLPVLAGLAVALRTIAKESTAVQPLAYAALPSRPPRAVAGMPMRVAPRLSPRPGIGAPVPRKRTFQ